MCWLSGPWPLAPGGAIGDRRQGVQHRHAGHVVEVHPLVDGVLSGGPWAVRDGGYRAEAEETVEAAEEEQMSDSTFREKFEKAKASVLAAFGLLLLPLLLANVAAAPELRSQLAVRVLVSFAVALALVGLIATAHSSATIPPRPRMSPGHPAQFFACVCPGGASFLVALQVVVELVLRRAYGTKK